MNTFTNQTNLLTVRQQRLGNIVVILAMFHTFIPLTNSHAIYRHTSRIKNFRIRKYALRKSVLKICVLGMG